MKPEWLGRRLLSSLLLICILGIFYANTLAPDITWANSGDDGGDLITAAATGGVAHPSGYPTYLILAKLFQLFPFGTLAFRTNLLSAVCATLAALVVSDLVRRRLKSEDTAQTWAAFLAGLGFGLSPLLWSQAVITEVYALHSLFVALILWFMPLNGGVPSRERFWLDRIGSLIFGLALGNHITILFLLPPWLLAGTYNLDSGVCLRNSNEYVNEKKASLFRRSLGTLPSRFVWKVIFRRLVWMCFGLLVYLALPLWARSRSPVNWGNPIRFEGFWWLISGRLYQGMVFGVPNELIWPRMRQWVDLLLSQYSLVGFMLAIFGFLFGKQRSKRFLWTTGYIFLVYMIFAFGYNTPDWFTLTIPAFLVLGLWFGLGVVALGEKIAQIHWQNIYFFTLAGLISLVILVNAGFSFVNVDASKDMTAVRFGDDILSRLPKDAVVITRENKDTFTLWYYHFVLGKRPDIAVINSGSLIYDWYRERMSVIYPSLVLVNHNGCYPCMLHDLTSKNARPICETLLDSSDPLICVP